MTVEDRFWAKVEKTDGCWLWTGSRVRGGYGMFKFGPKNQMANRVSLELAGKPAPFDKAVARHKCDNPSCVNPQHLEWGTQRQNMQDALERNRFCMDQLHRRHEALRARRVVIQCSHCRADFSAPMSRQVYSKNFCGRACQTASQAAITHCHAGHEFTEKNTYLAPKTGARNCRACAADKARARRKSA